VLDNTIDSILRAYGQTQQYIFAWITSQTEIPSYHSVLAGMWKYSTSYKYI